MPKMKTHRGAAKRFRKTARGKLLRAQTSLRHNLSSKNRKRKRRLSRAALVSDADLAKTRRLFPYFKKM